MNTRSVAIVPLVLLLLPLAPAGASAQEPVTSVLAGMGTGGGQVRNLSVADGSTLATATPFGPVFAGGVRVASADINDDGTPDFIVGAGPGSGLVRVLDGEDLSVLWSFSPFGGFFFGGVYVASGDINGDGRADVIAGAGAGGGQIRVYSGVDQSLIVTRIPFGGLYFGGVTVASGDIDGDTRDDLVAGTALGGSLRVIDGVDGSTILSSSPYGFLFFNGIHVAAGDVNGDGRDDVITGPGLVLRQVRVFSGIDGSQIAAVTPYPTGGVGGVTVAAGDVNGDNHADIITGPGLAAQPVVKIISGASHATLTSFPAFAPTFLGGIFVAAVAEAQTAPAFTSDDETTFQVGVAGTFDVTTDGGAGPVVLTFTGTLPAGVTFTDNGDGTGTLATPDPGTGGEYPLVFHANDGVNPQVDQDFLLTVNDPPAITSADNDSFSLGVSESFTVTTTGFPTPALTESGALPAGISFTDNGDGTGSLLGTATQSGVFPITFTAANGVTPDAVQNFTLTVACPAITVSPSGALPDGHFGVAYGPITFTQVGSTGTVAWSATGLPAGLTIGSSSGVLSGTPNNTVLNAAITVTATDEFGCQGSSNVTLTIRPDADDETFNGGVGGTQFAVGVPVTTPNVFVDDNVKNGDAGPAPLTVTYGAAANGTVTPGATDGTFVYTPNLNFAGPSDSFSYTLTDGNGFTNTATVTINLANLVWYVNSAGANGDGRSHSPFNNLASAGAASASLSFIYVHTGGPTTAGALAMDASQTLHGAGALFTLNSLTIAATGAPTATETTTLANNTIVNGMNYATLAAPALVAAGVSGPVAIDLVNTAGGSSALSLTNVTASVTVTNSSFVNAAGAEVLISGGTGAASIGAAISSNAGRSVDIQGRTGGTVTFTGPVTDTALGILLNGNTGSTTTFAGGLNLSTGANTAFTATGGGSVNATQNNTTIVNTIATTTGTALTVTNTSIGAGGLTFRSISANGAASGIVLTNTGSAAGLTVTGNGGNCTSAATCTGGAIQNTTGDGLALNQTAQVALTRLFVASTGRHGIGATAVIGLTLTSTRVQEAGNDNHEHGLNLVDVTGTVAIDAATFSGAARNLVFVDNVDTNVTFTVVDSQFSQPAVVGPFAFDAIVLAPSGTASIAASIQGSTFTNIVGSSAFMAATGLAATGDQSLTFSNNTVTVTLAGRASGLLVNGQHSTATTIAIDDNIFTSAGGLGVITVDANDESTVQGTISGNQVANAASGGMFVVADEGGTADIVIDGNTITNAASDGILAANFGGAGISTMQLAITNNVVDGHSADPGQAFIGGIAFFNFEDTSCLVLRGNSVTGTPAAPACGGADCSDYYLEEFDGTLTLEEVPDTAETTATAAYVNSINDPGPVTIFGAIDLTNGAACNLTLMAVAGPATSCGAAAPVMVEPLSAIHEVAMRRVEAGVAPAGARPPVGDREGLRIQLRDLPGARLGQVLGGRISLDPSAAGWGWFVDPTPDDDEEFEEAPGTGELRARAGGPADGRMDLLTALMHEIGHARGAVDLDPSAHPGHLMGAGLAPGGRRRPAVDGAGSPGTTAEWAGATAGHWTDGHERQRRGRRFGGLAGLSRSNPAATAAPGRPPAKRY